jgi:hypothetical protein
MTQMATDTPTEAAKRVISMKAPPAQPTKRGMSMKMASVVRGMLRATSMRVKRNPLVSQGVSIV